MSECKTIIGIDPGTNILGFGVIDVMDGKPVFREMGVVNLRGEKDSYSKLKRILVEIGRLCDIYKPQDMALESPFLGKNAQVIFKLGRAQGAAILAAKLRDIEVYEYAPRKAKVAITGNGAASKEQVSNMVSKLLHIGIEGEYLDASDALAIAICHFYQLTNPLGGKSQHGGWEKFVEAHPDRIKFQKKCSSD